MAPFFLIFLFSPVLAGDENCDQSEATFRNCLRVNLVSNPLIPAGFDRDDDKTIAARAAKWQTTFEKCGARNSECYLQTQLIKMTNDLIESMNEKSLMDLEESAYVECKRTIIHEYTEKCRNISSFDEYGFRLSIEKTDENHDLCLAEYAHKSNKCGKEFAARYTREVDIQISKQRHMDNFWFLGQYLRNYTD